MKFPPTVILPLLLALWPATPLRAASPAPPSGSAMVVTAQRLATEAGVDILRAGGNAIDAAVAVGYAEAVVNPCCGNIGGGGFMILRLVGGAEHFIDFRETAPAAATASMYLGSDGKPVPDASLVGWRAVAVPGTVAGLDTALERWGTMTRAQVMAPAIRLARDGFALSDGDAAILRESAANLVRDPEAARIFLHPDGQPPEIGERVVQPALAATLQAIADQGSDAFYRGATARALEAGSQAGGGILTAADLGAYQAHVGEPLRCAYRGYTVLSAPPPSSGGTTLCEILGVLEGYDLRAAGWHSAASLHAMAEAMRHAFVDRNLYLGDPAFVADPLDWLLSAQHLEAIRAAIGDRATPTAGLRAGEAPHEHPETTSYAVVDRAGNAVGVTYTLNGSFGAGVMAPGTGILLNDEMDDFTTAPDSPNMFGLVQGKRNAIAPGKRPLSSMAPTILLRDGRLAMVVGSPGGSRIITTVLQVILNIVDHGMTPQEAVDAPRIHMQGLPDSIAAERFALSPDTRQALVAMGYRIEEQRAWSSAEAIVAEPAREGRPAQYWGAHDSRRPAGAAMAE